MIFQYFVFANVSFASLVSDRYISAFSILFYLLDLTIAISSLLFCRWHFINVIYKSRLLDRKFKKFVKFFLEIKLKLEFSFSKLKKKLYQKVLFMPKYSFFFFVFFVLLIKGVCICFLLIILKCAMKRCFFNQKIPKNVGADRCS